MSVATVEVTKVPVLTEDEIKSIVEKVGSSNDVVCSAPEGQYTGVCCVFFGSFNQGTCAIVG